jgi:hypothetical protein
LYALGQVDTVPEDAIPYIAYRTLWQNYGIKVELDPGETLQALEVANALERRKKLNEKNR